MTLISRTRSLMGPVWLSRDRTHKCCGNCRPLASRASRETRPNSYWPTAAQAHTHTLTHRHTPTHTHWHTHTDTHARTHTRTHSLLPCPLLLSIRRTHPHTLSLSLSSSFCLSFSSIVLFHLRLTAGTDPLCQHSTRLLMTCVNRDQHTRVHTLAPARLPVAVYFSVAGFLIWWYQAKPPANRFCFCQTLPFTRLNDAIMVMIKWPPSKRAHLAPSHELSRGYGSTDRS